MHSQKLWALLLSCSLFCVAHAEKPIALILTASENNAEFRPYRTTYIREGHRLIERGYDVRELTLSNPERLRDWAKPIPERGIGFVWFRAHGSPTSMEFTHKYKLTSDAVARDFDWLKSKLSDSAVIYLESCLTGSLEGDFTQNMQFAFAKLTLDLRNVEIAAPSQSSCLHGFNIDDQGKFDFEMKPSPYSSENIAVVLGQSTKDVLRTDPENKEELLKSLGRNLPRSVLPQAYVGDLDRRLIEVILASKPALVPDIKYLIEKFHVVDRDPQGINGALQIQSASPLFAAIYTGNKETVQLLLQKGANFKVDYRGITPLEYAQQLANDPNKRNQSKLSKQSNFDEVLRLLEDATAR